MLGPWLGFCDLGLVQDQCNSHPFWGSGMQDLLLLPSSSLAVIRLVVTLVMHSCMFIF